MNFLSWNARGGAEKRQRLREMVYLHKTDVVAIQESKKEECSKRFLDSLTTQINWWITQPSNGSSGREILGVDDSKFYILGH
jgi:exonuclease III